MPSESVLKYYQDNHFNPVMISVDDKATWESHFAKRLNLYQRHLGIPLSLLRGRSVLEFGCNSGENALVLASVGANLTLVEPNQQVLPRLKALFKKFGFEKQIIKLLQKDIDSFSTDKSYDLVIAEGFLFSLPNRDQLIDKIAQLLTPRGLAVISFNDQYGCLLEQTKKMIFWRVCQLSGIEDIHSEASLELARRLYAEDFANLNASRNFSTWWKDVLVNPLFRFDTFWSYKELLPLIEKAGCEFYTSSPGWNSIENFRWYKDIPDINNRHKRLMEEWNSMFPFFITGMPTSPRHTEPVTSEVVESVSDLVKEISGYTSNMSSSIESIEYPLLLDKYLMESKDPKVLNFNTEMKRLYDALTSAKLDELITIYHNSESLRKLWGAPFHYISFMKSGKGR